jgi:folate-dependent phosphoribosylglycinamide formyltransferase PurN
VALAGFLKIYPVKPDWAKRVVNIHPALLPKFGGKGMYGDFVHAAVLNAGERASGCTVHFVDDHYDEGRILAQATVEVLAGDTPETLAARVFAAECRLYPDALARIVRGELA